MNVTLSLNPEVERGLVARAQARGISLDEFLQEVVAKEAGVSTAPEPQQPGAGFGNLSDLLLNSPFAEANLNLERSR